MLSVRWCEAPSVSHLAFVHAHAYFDARQGSLAPARQSSHLLLPGAWDAVLGAAVLRAAVAAAALRRVALGGARKGVGLDAGGAVAVDPKSALRVASRLAMRWC